MTGPPECHPAVRYLIAIPLHTRGDQEGVGFDVNDLLKAERPSILSGEDEGPVPTWIVVSGQPPKIVAKVEDHDWLYRLTWRQRSQNRGIRPLRQRRRAIVDNQDLVIVKGGKPDGS